VDKLKLNFGKRVELAPHAMCIFACELSKWRTPSQI